MSWVLIWHGNWMTRDSSLSLLHESAEFSWLVPPTTADYRRWAGYGQLSEVHSSFCVSISSSGQQFAGAAQTTHSTTLQSEGLYRGYLLMGIWSRGGSCEPNPPVNGYSSLLATHRADVAKCRQWRGYTWQNWWPSYSQHLVSLYIETMLHFTEKKVKEMLSKSIPRHVRLV